LGIAQEYAQSLVGLVNLTYHLEKQAALSNIWSLQAMFSSQTRLCTAQFYEKLARSNGFGLRHILIC